MRSLEPDQPVTIGRSLPTALKLSRNPSCIIKHHGLRLPIAPQRQAFRPTSGNSREPLSQFWFCDPKSLMQFEPSGFTPPWRSGPLTPGTTLVEPGVPYIRRAPQTPFLPFPALDRGLSTYPTLHTLLLHRSTYMLATPRFGMTDPRIRSILITATLTRTQPHSRYWRDRFPRCSYRRSPARTRDRGRGNRQIGIQG